MRWLIWYGRSLWCRHTWEYEESDYDWRRTYASGLTRHFTGTRVSATCTQCGWHRSYEKWRRLT